MNWQNYRLGEFISIKHGWAFKGEYFSSEGNYLLLTPGNAYEQGGLKIRPGKEKFYTGEFPSEYLLKKDDIVVIMTDLVQSAPILGGAIIIPNDDYFLHNQRLGLVELKSDESIDKNFLYYLLNSPCYRAQIRGSATGATVRHTAPQRIYDCNIFIPSSVKEQAVIGNILMQYDLLIENNRKRIALLEESARLLYQEWFVKFRFPGFRDCNLNNGIPEKWSMKNLIEICIVNRSNVDKKNIIELIKYIDISSVNEGNISQVTEIPFLDAPGRARRVVQHGDILWSCVRPNRRSYTLLWQPDENMIASTGFAVLTSKSIPFSYLYFATTSDDFVSYLSNRATGAAYPAVTGKDFEDATILCPTEKILNEFDKICLPILEQKYNLSYQNTLLTKARDELLPKLISGQIKV